MSRLVWPGSARGRALLGLIAAAVGCAGLLGAVTWAPLAVLVSLGMAVEPWGRAWQSARGTALRPALVWLALALVLGTLGQLAALGEPLQQGRPAAGHGTYLCCLTTLAGLISVLNARRPGNGAWALLMGLLVLIFLIPWLENSGLSRAVDPLRRLRLHAPWTVFYGLLVLAGVTNYLPTRSAGPASVVLGMAFLAEYRALTHPGLSAATRAGLWSLFPALLASALLLVQVRSRPPAASSDLERLWLWFRERWGVVWALRVRDRFHREAVLHGWPIRLSWQGVVALAGPAAVPEQAELALRGLLRRFADADRLEAAARQRSP